jgi:hypothetical protein
MQPGRGRLDLCNEHRVERSADAKASESETGEKERERLETASYVPSLPNMWNEEGAVCMGEGRAVSLGRVLYV